MDRTMNNNVCYIQQVGPARFFCAADDYKHGCQNYTAGDDHVFCPEHETLSPEPKIKGFLTKQAWLDMIRRSRERDAEAVHVLKRYTTGAKDDTYMSQDVFRHVFGETQFSAASQAPCPTCVPRCPVCNSTDGTLGTSEAYFICRECHVERYWTKDYKHPGHWPTAIAASPFGRKSEMLSYILRLEAEIAALQAGLIK